MNKSIGVVLFSAVLLSACSKPEPAPEPVRAVRVVTVGSGSLDAAHEYAAEVRPRIESRLGFRVAGKITRRQAEVGQRVKAGQVLAELDAVDYKLANNAARAQVSAAQVNRDLAAADYKRYKDLRDQNFISSAELDRRDAALKAAQAQLEQAQAQQSAQGNQAVYSTLTADVAGVVTAVEAEAGQVVSAGAPVVRIAADGVRDVVFSVPEDRLGSIKVGMPVEVSVWASQKRLTGKVREIGASADVQTRTFLVKVAVEGGADLPLGSTVYVVPQVNVAGGMPAIKLPTSALKQDGQTSAVWVLDKATMTVKSQPIQIATADGNAVVIASGLRPGDVVVSAGVHVLSPGQKVTVYQEKSANTSAAAVLAPISAANSVAK